MAHFPYRLRVSQAKSFLKVSGIKTQSRVNIVLMTLIVFNKHKDVGKYVSYPANFVNQHSIPIEVSYKCAHLVPLMSLMSMNM